jgi:hypothetical protein
VAILLFDNFLYVHGCPFLSFPQAPVDRSTRCDSSSNGHSGILHQETEGAWIEGNRFSYNSGAWGASPLRKGPSFGIVLEESNQVLVFNNTARNNMGADVSGDGAGEIVFAMNACETASRQGLCRR